MEPASFINLDLEFSADGPLDELAHHFERTSFVLFHGEVENGYRLAVEPVINGELSQDIQACTEHFLAIVRSLPPELISIWNSCSSRVFDYGFDGGLEQPPLRVMLPFSSLVEIAQGSIDIQITVYPFREASSDD